MKSLSGEAKKTIAPTRSSGFCVRLSARSAAAAERILTMPSLGFSSESVLPGDAVDADTVLAELLRGVP